MNGAPTSLWLRHITKRRASLLEDLDAYYSLRLLLKGPSSDMKYQYICLDEVQGIFHLSTANAAAYLPERTLHPERRLESEYPEQTSFL